MPRHLTKVQYFYGLSPGEVLSLDLHHVHTLEAHGSTVWVTRAGDPSDYWLTPGERLQIEPGRRYWVSADHVAEAALEREVPHHFSALGELRNWWHGRREARNDVTRLPAA